MKKRPVNPTAKTAVLSVSPLEEDHSSLRAMLNHSAWDLREARTVAAALVLVRKREIGVVLCDCDLKPGAWIDMLEKLQSLRNPPPLIVTSRLADERLWAEALNLGAYDVLAKPFEAEELVRSLSLASSQRRWRQGMPVMAANAARAAC
ncbi:MAG: response regulator [Bryobacteraceae bacterium]